MQVFLKIIGGKNDGREIKISVPEFVIGRGEAAHLRPSSDLVSRRHCSIELVDGKVLIADLGSRNGTFVNGELLKQPHEAKPGDRVRVGRLQFELVIDVASASIKKKKVNSVVEAASRTVEAKPAQSLEDSITDWLDDDDDDSPFEEKDAFVAHETIQLSTEETQEFVSTDAKSQDATEPTNELGEVEGEAVSKRKDTPGKLPPQPKQHHVDSTDAAGDVLKQFFNRR